MNTYGFDAGYKITPELTASVGYYYQQGDLGLADGSGIKGRLAVDVTKNIEFGGTYTYDNAFESRASADLTIRFGGSSHKEKSKEQAKAEEQPQIKQLSSTPSNRDVRVHDDFDLRDWENNCVIPGSGSVVDTTRSECNSSSEGYKQLQQQVRVVSECTTLSACENTLNFYSGQPLDVKGDDPVLAGQA